jgi:hypothetical protein
MMTRAEKLFNMRAQVAKAASDIDHGDTYGACLALGDALSAVLTFLEEEMPEKLPMQPGGEKVKEPDSQTRKALDVLRSEPTKMKRR